MAGNTLASTSVKRLLKRIAPYALLLLINAAVFHSALTFEFVNFDDTEYVIRNEHVHKGLTTESVRWAFSSVHAGYWIPLTWLSFMLDHELYGLNPAGFHASNLVLHILNTWLLFAFFFRLTQSVWKSFAVATLFAIHPLHVESVVWVTERKDVLSTFFMLLAILAYPKAVDGRRKGVYGMFGLLCWILSLMAKGTAVTLPALLLLLDVWPLRRWRVDEGRRKAVRMVLEKVPLLPISIAFAAVTFWAQRKGGAVGTLEQYALAVRLANAALSYVRYLFMMVWPARLAAFYPHPGARVSYIGATGAFVLLVVLSFWVASQMARRPYLFFGWFFYLISLLPMIGIVQVGGQALADRFTYVPLIGLFVAVVWGSADVWEWIVARQRLWPVGDPWARRVPAAFFAVVSLALALRAYRQSLTWKDTLTLFHHALAVTKNNAYPHYNLGAEYFARGDLEKAAYHFTLAVELNKKDYEALFNLGNIRRLQGRPSEAVEAYRLALQRAPWWAALWNNLGLARLDLGQTNEALTAFEQALRCDTNHIEAVGNLGVVHLDAQRYEEAARTFREGLRRAPQNAFFHYGLARALAGLGRVEDARQQFAEAVRLDPGNADAWREYANLELLLGRREAALRLYRRALAVAPAHVETLNNLAYVLLGSGASNEVREAVGFARQACEKASPVLVPSCMHTLALALAADGHHAEAADIAEKAADAARAVGRNEFAEQLLRMAQKWRECGQ